MSDKPTLPSIHIMLTGMAELPPAGGKGAYSHRRHASDLNVNGTRLGFENLSLSSSHQHKPRPMEPSAAGHQALPPFRPTPLYQYPYDHPRSARNLHSRSFSDYTHPYMTTPPPPPATSMPSGLLAPASHLQHRRAISTSTLDSIKQQTQPPHPPFHHIQQHPPINSTSSHQHAPPSLHASLSSCTTTSSVASPHSPTFSLRTPTNGSVVDDEPLYDTSSSAATDDDADDDHHYHQLASQTQLSPSSSSTTTTTTTQNDENDTMHIGTGPNRYKCCYCQKGFSRPSSLRIHIYSHTGEKPFECPEQGCSRKFSVQSNMRRHLRVHRTGRHLKMKRTPPSIKPLAAKPSWMQHQSDAASF
ncbi:hypothetical protein BC940DRAFT_302500 [Gongronella butleri]|nr:hypothetical protein BC940DRAFT_302500 [Gongronella butleri]